MSYIEKLSSYTGNIGKKGGKDFIKKYLDKKNIDYNSLKVIHITGTAGKGSTASMISKGLQDANYEVGLFTSPHILKINERIKINGIDISNEKFEKYLEEVFNDEPTLAFSEILTIVMINYFLDEKVDYVVIECFVGGENDPTNFLDNKVATVITSIGLDHTHLLGNTKEDILKEKLGIARENVPLFARLLKYKNIIDKIHNKTVYVETLKETSLKGDVQRQNAGLAFEVLKYLNINEKKIEKSLMDTKWPGRMQYIKDNIIVDCAHNKMAMEELFKYVNKKYKDKKIYILFALSNNHNFETDFKPYLKAKEVVYTMPKMFKMINPKEYAQQNAKVILSVKEAYEYLENKLDIDSILIVCGSLFLASEVLSFTGIGE